MFIQAQRKFEILDPLLYLDPNKSSLTECWNVWQTFDIDNYFIKQFNASGALLTLAFKKMLYDNPRKMGKEAVVVISMGKPGICPRPPTWFCVLQGPPKKYATYTPQIFVAHLRLLLNIYLYRH